MERENVMNCFTEVEEGVNAEFNKVTTKCISSTNNAFSMDCEGNLVVNSIMTREGSIGGLDIDMVYPIGSIYLSTNSANPGDLFGGTWEQIIGRFLLAENPSAEAYKAGKTGGKVYHEHSTKDHTLTENQIPSHRHNVPLYASHWNTNNAQGVMNAPAWGKYSATGGVGYRVATSDNTYAGGGKAHNHGNTSSADHMPPFLSVYAWKRIA